MTFISFIYSGVFYFIVCLCWFWRSWCFGGGGFLGAEGVQQLDDARILSGVAAASEPVSCSVYPETLPEQILAVRDPGKLL